MDNLQYAQIVFAHLFSGSGWNNLPLQSSRVSRQCKRNSLVKPWWRGWEFLQHCCSSYQLRMFLLPFLSFSQLPSFWNGMKHCQTAIGIIISMISMIRLVDRMKSDRLYAQHWGALAQIYVRSQPYGGSDKSNNGHRYDSIPIVNGISASGQLININHAIYAIWKAVALWVENILLCVSDIQWLVGSVVEHPQWQTRNDHSWNELPAYSLHPWRAWQVLRALQEFWFHHRSLQPRPFPRDRNIQQHSTLWSIAHSSPVCCRES